MPKRLKQESPLAAFPLPGAGAKHRCESPVLSNRGLVSHQGRLDAARQRYTVSVRPYGGTDPGGPPDFDGDGNVGASDLLALLVNWARCPS